jgi:Uma2 family endonuclease
MAEPGRRRATYEDVLRAPEHLIAELMDGELFTSPRLPFRHGHAATVLLAMLGSAFHRGYDGPGGWTILFGPELHLGNDVLVPDLAVWRDERLGELTDAVGIEIVPDWICKVLSPSTMRTDRLRKLPIYAASAVAYAWLLDPTERLLEVFRLSNGTWNLAGVHGGNDRVFAEPFDAIELDLAMIWGRTEEPAE